MSDIPPVDFANNLSQTKHFTSVDIFPNIIHKKVAYLSDRKLLNK